MKQRRTWLLVVVGVAVLLVVAALGAIIATTAWVQQNLSITTASAEDATTAFTTVRRAFGDQPALFELQNDRPVYNPARLAAAPTPPRPIERLYILIWDPRDGELASLSLPFWLVRLKSGSIEFSGYASGLDDNGVTLRPEDLEKFGPGIILDTTTPDGEQILLWAQ